MVMTGKLVYKKRGQSNFYFKNGVEKLIEIPYTKEPQIKDNKKNVQNIFFNPENRVSRLSRLINSKDIVRFIECHNPLTGLMIGKTEDKSQNQFREFDGIWSSSLTDLVSNGKPDNQSVELSTRI